MEIGNMGIGNEQIHIAAFPIQATFQGILRINYTIYVLQDVASRSYYGSWLLRLYCT